MVLIDDRRGSVELAKHIPADKEILRLEFADFAWTGNGPAGPVVIGVERKTIRDLVNCMVDGRFVGHQLPGLLRAYDVVYLVVEGMWRRNPATGMLESKAGKEWRLLMGSKGARPLSFLHTLTHLAGVRTWRTSHQRETGWWVAECHDWWQKPWDRHKSLQHFHVSQGPRVVGGEVLMEDAPSLVARIAKEFSGVGWDRARAIGEAFGSLREFMAADEVVLAVIPGIGKKTAHNIVKERDT
jgi:ERCC4-type nuclease